MLLVLALVGCANDFELKQAVSEPAVEDEAADTAAPTTDTAEAPADTADTAGDTVPVEEDPVDTGTPAETDDPAPEDDCTATDDLIYALSRDDGTLYTFDPAVNAFSALGRVSCGTTQTAGSMAVGRDGVAYIRYADDRVYALDLATMDCTTTSYSDRATDFDSFGMGYATDAADTWREQLYVANETTLGVLDPSTWTIRALGRMPSQSELTGTAEGELWAILPLESPAKIVQLDTSTGSTLATIAMPRFPEPANIDTFAFATWGGDFYVFVGEHGFGRTTDVYRVERDGTQTRVLENVGFNVVGAGVSTCAPTE